MIDKQAREDIEHLRNDRVYKYELKYLEERVTSLENSLTALMRHFSLKPVSFPARLEIKRDE